MWNEYKKRAGWLLIYLSWVVLASYGVAVYFASLGT